MQRCEVFLNQVKNPWRTMAILQGRSWNELPIFADRRCASSETSTAAEFFNAAADGDLSGIKKIENVAVDSRDPNGWTALMMASRHGHVTVIAELLARGANPYLKTPTGHTAKELASFFQHKNVKEYFDCNIKKTESDRNFFTHSPLSRKAFLRSNRQWIESAFTSDKTTYMLMKTGHPLVVPLAGEWPTHSHRKMTLVRASYEQISELGLVDLNNETVVFLGTNYNTGSDHGSDADHAYFAVDVSHIEKRRMREVIHSDVEFLRVYPGLLQLNVIDAAICAQARSLMDWHFRYKFCATCGNSTHIDEAGYRRVCDNEECMTHEGIYNSNYPRVDPTTIAAVISDDHQSCLLARKKSFLPGMYSCIAGFIEPGESVEDACIREIEEEVGIQATRVEYQSSQPWPMPSVLMLGCLAFADPSSQIQLDKRELEEAKWFSREEIVLMLLRQDPNRRFIPPAQAIAHQLIKKWLLMSAFN